MTDMPRNPQVFRITTETERPKKSAPKIEFAPIEEHPVVITAPMAEANAKRPRLRWGYLLITALLSLAALWFSLSLTNLIASLFAWSMSLGWLSVALASVAGVALVAILLHEFIGLMRLRKVERLQINTAKAFNQNDRKAAAAARVELQSLYSMRADLSWTYAQWRSHDEDIIDPPAAMRLAERLLLEPLDEVAHRIIAKRARRVTLLTTVTPTATLDILLVGSQNLMMIRELAEVYGGRPSFFATIRLVRMAAAHLAVTAGLALSDNLLHLVVGKGLLGRLSARFGEGAINGILTSRIGLAACDVLRPIAKTDSKRETLASLIKELANFGGEPKS